MIFKYNRIMGPYQEQQTKRNYNKISRWYDLIAGSSEQRFRKIGLDVLDPQPGNTVLEIGCGTGQSLLTISQQVQTKGAVYGLDLSPGMLSVAQKRIRESDSKNTPGLINGSALHLPFPNNSLDRIFMCFTLELFPEAIITIALSEIYRIMKPNGHFCVVHMAKAVKPNPIVQAYQWAHQTYPNICDCRPIDSLPFLGSYPWERKTTRRKSMWGLPVEIHLFSKTI